MKLKESFVFVFLIVGIVSIFGGLALVSRGMTYGWGAVALAVPILVVVARSMRLRSSQAPVATKEDEPAA